MPEGPDVPQELLEASERLRAVVSGLTWDESEEKWIPDLAVVVIESMDHEEVCVALLVAALLLAAHERGQV